MDTWVVTLNLGHRSIQGFTIHSWDPPPFIVKCKRLFYCFVVILPCFIFSFLGILEMTWTILPRFPRFRDFWQRKKLQTLHPMPPILDVHFSIRRNFRGLVFGSLVCYCFQISVTTDPTFSRILALQILENCPSPVMSVQSGLI